MACAALKPKKATWTQQAMTFRSAGSRSKARISRTAELSSTNSGKKVINMVRYIDVPKKVRNAIEARINATVKKYGHLAFRLVANKFLSRVSKEHKLELEIQAREEELEKLKKKVR